MRATTTKRRSSAARGAPLGPPSRPTRSSSGRRRTSARSGSRRRATISAAKGLGLADNARLFALLSMVAANSYIVDWDAKFTTTPGGRSRRSATAISTATTRPSASRLDRSMRRRCTPSIPRRRRSWQVRRRRCSNWCSREGEPAVHGHRPCRPEADAEVHQHRAAVGRAMPRARLGRDPFPEFARGRRRHGARGRPPTWSRTRSKPSQ